MTHVCCVLLRVAACCCVLLRAAACCCVLCGVLALRVLRSCTCYYCLCIHTCMCCCIGIECCKLLMLMCMCLAWWLRACVSRTVCVVRPALRCVLRLRVVM